MSGRDEIPHWMKMFINQDLMEEKNEMMTPTHLLDENGRSFIWWLCKKFSISADGVMGQSCTLLERFMAKQLQVYSYLQRGSSEWQQIKEELSARVPLLASVCIAITSKMFSSEQPLHTTAIHEVLSKLEYNYTKAQINTAEIDVFSKLGYHVPMFTNVEKATNMATDVGMTGLYIDAVALVTEVVEYYRRSIQEEIIALACSILSDKKIHADEIANIRHIHLVAGCVIATGLFLKFTGPDPLIRLCFLTKCSKAYLKCIGDVIHKRLISECVLGYPQPENQQATEPPAWNLGSRQPSNQQPETRQPATWQPSARKSLTRQPSTQQPTILQPTTRKRKLQE